MATFLATLTPMLTLFLCIAVGFIVGKTKILPDNASKTMAKMETWIFSPALSFMTMVRFCTVDSLSTHLTNVVFSIIAVAVAMAIAIPLSKVFAGNDTAERGIYSYALTFANLGYMGDPIILALFGEETLSYYKLFSLPLNFLIYTWGISVLTPRETHGGSPLKRILNAPTVGMLLGITVGLSGLGNYLPSFMTSALDTLKACMGPVAMLLAGVTIAKYDLLEILKNKKVYIATALRLVILPALIVFLLFGVRAFGNAVLGMNIGKEVLFLAFFAFATPLGLNTVVFPESYGGNPKTGASMAMISHTLCVITIPILYSVMVAIFGAPF